MKKVTCDKFGNCPLADGSVHEIGDDYVCAHREETGECGMAEGKERGPVDPNLLMRIGLIALAVLIIAGMGYGIYLWLFSSPRCEVAQVSQLLRTDPKLQELEKAGTDCLVAGRGQGDSEKMVAGTLALRTAFDKGSATAAYELGQLFDPLERARLESESKLPQLLPAIDAELALRYYDKAAAGGQAKAAALADRLRKSNPVLRVDARGKNGGALSLPNYDGIFQRVLTKPGAMMVGAPDPSANGQPIPLFRLMYVFEKKPGWLKVGAVLESGGEGWVRQDQVEPWNVMLAMRYLPQGNRSPALFFNDEIALKSVIGAVDAKDQVDALIRSADGGSPDPRLAAIEDKSINWSSSPYVMPVLRTTDFTTDDGRKVHLAKVGSVSGLGAPGSGPARAANTACTEKSAKDLIHQVVFVIDTTESMGPYIAGVRRIAETWRDQVKRSGILNQVRFGVVAYRNNMDQEPQRSRLEYVHKVILAPSTGNADAFVSEMAKVRPATVSTRSFDEDPVAGLRDALGFDWSQGCGARQIYLISDAGALASDDPLSAYPGTGLSSITAEAREKEISIYPVHLLTPEASKAGNVDSTAALYRRDLFDGIGDNRYVPIPNGSPAGFDGYLGKIGALIQNANKIVPRGPQAGPRDVKDMVLSDIFAAQQRFLGAAARAQVPTFAASWTSDRDIADPNRASLEVCVFLTRRQLSQLADTVQRLINNAKQKNVNASDFFSMLRMVSAATAQDPQRFGDKATTMGALMPSFLSLLPYKSEVLELDEQDWRSMGAIKQDAFVRRLDEKLTFYRSLNGIQDKWQSFGSSDSNNDVALVPLSRMP